MSYATCAKCGMPTDCEHGCMCHDEITETDHGEVKEWEIRVVLALVSFSIGLVIGVSLSTA